MTDGRRCGVATQPPAFLPSSLHPTSCVGCRWLSPALPLITSRCYRSEGGRRGQASGGFAWATETRKHWEMDPGAEMMSRCVSRGSRSRKDSSFLAPASPGPWGPNHASSLVGSCKWKNCERQ